MMSAGSWCQENLSVSWQQNHIFSFSRQQLSNQLICRQLVEGRYNGWERGPLGKDLGSNHVLVRGSMSNSPSLYVLDFLSNKIKVLLCKVLYGGK